MGEISDEESIFFSFSNASHNHLIMVSSCVEFNQRVVKIHESNHNLIFDLGEGYYLYQSLEDHISMLNR